MGGGIPCGADFKNRTSYLPAKVHALYHQNRASVQAKKRHTWEVYKLLPKRNTEEGLSHIPSRTLLKTVGTAKRNRTKKGAASRT